MEKDSSNKWLVKIVVVGCKDDLEGWIRLSIVKLSITGTLAIISYKFVKWDAIYHITLLVV